MPDSNPVLMLLRETRALLTPPGAWCQGALARDAKGEPVAAGSPEATCWCLGGAVWKARRRSDLRLVEVDFLPYTHGRGVLQWNDQPGRTQAQVLALLDAAIAAAEAGDA